MELKFIALVDGLSSFSKFLSYSSVLGISMLIYSGEPAF